MTNLLYPVWVILAIDIIVQMEVILGLGDKCILHIHTYYVLHIYSTFCTVPTSTTCTTCTLVQCLGSENWLSEKQGKSCLLEVQLETLLTKVLLLLPENVNGTRWVIVYVWSLYVFSRCENVTPCTRVDLPGWSMVKKSKICKCAGNWSIYP